MPLPPSLANAPKCGAKTKNGTPCQRPGMHSNGRCRLHGGATPAGPLHHNWKHGRQSKYAAAIPARLSEAYERAANDPDLVALTDELALVDARLNDLLQRVDLGESGEHIKAITEAAKAAKKCLIPAEREQALESLFLNIESAESDYAAWRGILEALELRRRLSESEIKRREKLGNMVTADKALTLVAAIVGIIRGEVTDKDTLKRISRRFEVLLSGTIPQAPVSMTQHTALSPPLLSE